MNFLLKTLSFAGLLLCVLPAVLVFTGGMELEEHYKWTLAGTVLWFATAPFWMNRKKLPG